MKKLEWQFSTGIAGGIVFSLGIPGKNGMVGKYGSMNVLSLKEDEMRVKTGLNPLSAPFHHFPWPLLSLLINFLSS